MASFIAYPVSYPIQVVYFGDSMRSDMFPASTFGKWETVMIVEEMEGEGVPRCDAAKTNEAQAEPQDKKGKFEVSSHKQLFPFKALSHLFTLLPERHILPTPSPFALLNATIYPP